MMSPASSESVNASKTIDKDKLRTKYAAQRMRLLAKRKLAETRMAEAREALRRIDREIAALEREQRQLQR
jgi:hypothetical protein